jgi:hypothetical protein
MQTTFIPLALAQDSLPDSTTRALRYRTQLPGTTLRRLPVDDPLQGVVLIPGVRLTGPDLGNTSTFTGLRIRGSAAGRSNVYVDGALLRFETLGGGGVGLASNAVDTLGILTGAAPAYLSDAGGGVISYRTRSGTARWTGGLRLESDAPFSDASSVGYNRFEGMVGGPLARDGKLTLVLSAALQGQQSSYRAPGAAATPSYLPNGIDTLTLPLLEQSSSGLHWPLDWSTARRGHGKLLYRYGASSQASLTLLGGDLQQRFFPAQFSLVPSAYSGAVRATAAAIVDVRHALGAWHGKPLALGVNLSLVRHQLKSGPLDSTVELSTRDPALGLGFDRLHFAGADIVGLPAHDAMIRGLRSGVPGLVVPYFNTRQDFAQSYASPYGIIDGTWPTGGYGGILSDVLERRIQGRAMLDWRKDSRQSNALGLDFERSNVSSYSSDIVRLIDPDVWTAKPARFGLFTENRFTLAGGIFDLGLRVDRFTPGGDLPNTPAFISSSGPNLWNPVAATDDSAYANSVARVFHPASAKTAWSPRIRFEYPVSDRTSVRLGYSRNVEPPTWGTFFIRSNSDLSFTPIGTAVFARDVEFGVAGLIEGGVRYAQGSVVLDLSAYQKDLPAYGGRFTPFADPKDSTSQVTVNALTALDNSHVWGTDLGVDWQRGWVTASAAYSFAHISSSPETNVLAGNPMSTHSGALALSVQVPRDWKQESWFGSLVGATEIMVWARLQSGATYAPAVPTGSGTVTTPQDLTLPAYQGEQLPAFKRVDLRLSKTVRVAGQKWSLYVDARDLFNFRNLISVFAETGDTANAAHHQLTIGDPVTPTGAYAQIRFRASNEGALEPDGLTVNLSSCATWSDQLNCFAWNRVEQRYGNGDQLFTVAEQQNAFESYYRDYFGGWRFYDPGRTIRVGVELAP